jgi:chromosomal replication initiation ATPase DnaA
MSASTQLPLVLPHAPSLRREDFMAGPSNADALRLIEAWPDWPSPAVLITGPSGSGKTHLAHIWAAHAGAAVVDAGALGADTLSLSAGRSVVVEDVRAGQVPEASLFHLFNAVREQGASLLITSRDRAEDWRVGLQDLRSRLRLATPVALGAPEDGLLRQVLVKLFADRQLLVEKPVIDYLVARMERSLSAAVRLVDTLDRAALSAGRRITRPMAAEVLAQASESSEVFADRQELSSY